MKILHVVPSYIPAWRYGGTIRSVHGLCRALARRGHSVDVYTTNVDGAGISDVPLERPVDVDGVGVRYFPSPFPRLYWSPWMGRALRQNAGKYDVIHSHSVFLWPTWAAARASKASATPHLMSPRGMLVPDLIRKKSKTLKTAWIRLIECRNIQEAAGIHMTSDVEAREASAFGFKMPSVYVIPNGIDVEAAAPVETPLSLSFKSQKPLILFLGRVNWKKGLDRLMPALRGIPEAHLAVVGNDEEGYKKTLIQIAERENVSGRVAFFDAVNDSDKRSLYRAADVFVLPSYSENFGNTVLEAMAEGCPVIVTPEVGLSAAVRETGAGLVSSGEPDSLAQAIAGLLADEPARRRMGDAGRRAAAERFGWDSVAARMEKVYLAIARHP